MENAVDLGTESLCLCAFAAQILFEKTNPISELVNWYKLLSERYL